MFDSITQKKVLPALTQRIGQLFGELLVGLTIETKVCVYIILLFCKLLLMESVTEQNWYSKEQIICCYCMLLYAP